MKPATMNDQPVNLATKFLKKKKPAAPKDAPVADTGKKVINVKPSGPKTSKKKTKLTGRKIKWRKQPPVPEGFYYQAIGYIRGVYRPNTEIENGTIGILLAEDGTAFPAGILRDCRRWFAKHEKSADEGWQVWTVYPKQNQIEGVKFIVSLKGVRVKAPDEAEGNFIIRGFCCHANMEEGKFVLRVWRNPGRAMPGKKVYPVHLVIDGFHQESPEGKYWYVEAVREGDRLVMIDAQVF